MDASAETSRSTCLSALALERLDANLLQGRELIRARTHLTSCASCRQRFDRMQADASAFRRSDRALTARRGFARAERRQRIRWTAFALAGVALAAAAPFALKGAPPVRHAQSPQQLHARTISPIYLEPRGGAAPVRLRHLSIQGEEVAFGEGIVEAVGESSRGPLTLQHTDVVGEVSGYVQQVTVTQEFANPFREPIEAIYVFPLPDDAAVDDMTLLVGERVVKGVIQRREQARQTYETAKQQGRRAALLDQERPNIFTQSIANVQPGESVKVTLRYVAPLKYDDGTFELNFPMVVGPRYIPGKKLAGESQGAGQAADTDRVPDGSRISPAALPAGERTGRDISVSFHIDAGMEMEELSSVSHRMRLDRASGREAQLWLPTEDRIPNKDLILRFRVAGRELKSALLTHSGARGKYFSLLVQPELEDAQPAPMPKEMVFLIDTSCSMTGAPLAAEKVAMRTALRSMNPRDTFMLIDFADSVSTFSRTPQANTPWNVEQAIGYLERLPASGGTNQLEGIQAALNLPRDPERVREVLLLTDGYIGNEDEIFGETQRILGDARIFSLGIGTSVNHYFLSRLAALGRGFYQYVRPDEDSTPAVERFQRRISRPLLTDIQIDWGGLQVSDVLPGKVPDLFDHQPFVVVGRVLAPGSGTVRITGRGSGGSRTTAVDVVLQDRDERNSALASMWARAKVEALERQQYGLEKSEVVRQITTIGLEYRLVTAYTSFVAVDQEVVRPAQATVAEKVDLPQGTTFGDEGKMGKKSATWVGAADEDGRTGSDGERRHSLQDRRQSIIKVVRNPKALSADANEKEKEVDVVVGRLFADGKSSSNTFGPGGLATGINNAVAGLKGGAGVGDAHGVGGVVDGDVKGEREAPPPPVLDLHTGKTSRGHGVGGLAMGKSRSTAGSGVGGGNFEGQGQDATKSPDKVPVENKPANTSRPHDVGAVAMREEPSSGEFEKAFGGKDGSTHRASRSVDVEALAVNDPSAKTADDFDHVFGTKSGPSDPSPKLKTNSPDRPPGLLSHGNSLGKMSLVAGDHPSEETVTVTGGRTRRKDLTLPRTANDDDFVDYFEVVKGRESEKRTTYLPDAPPTGGGIPDQLSMGDVMFYVRDQKAAIVACVREERRLLPDVSGTLVMRWTILANGHTSDISVQTDEFKDTPLAKCMLRLIKSWIFPPHQSAQDPINFPFMF